MNKKTFDSILSRVTLFYLGGVAGSWLAITWHGFTDFPLREIGALLWALMAPALLFGLGE